MHRNICTVIHACRKIFNFSSHSWIYFSKSHESWEKAQLFKHADLVEFREAWGDVETYFLGNPGSDRDRVLRISGNPGILFAGPVCANCGSRIFPCLEKASDRAWRRYAQWFVLNDWASIKKRYICRGREKKKKRERGSFSQRDMAVRLWGQSRFTQVGYLVLRNG